MLSISPHSSHRDELVRVCLLSALSVTLFYFEALTLIALSPLNILARRAGKTPSLYGWGLTLGAIVLIQLAGLGGGSPLGLWVPLFLLLGSFFVCFGNRPVGILNRLLSATLLLFLISLPLLFSKTSWISRFWDSKRIDELASLVQRFALPSLLSPEEALALLEKGLKETYLALYFLVLALGYWIGSLFDRSNPRKERLQDFDLPKWFIWLFLVPQTIKIFQILLSRSEHPLSLGALNPLLINVGVISSFLFWVQGLAVIRLLLTRRGVPDRLIRLILISLGTAVVLLPLIGWMAMWAWIATLLLGISATWIDYRKQKEV